MSFFTQKKRGDALPSLYLYARVLATQFNF